MPIAIIELLSVIFIAPYTALSESSMFFDRMRMFGSVISTIEIIFVMKRTKVKIDMATDKQRPRIVLNTGYES